MRFFFNELSLLELSDFSQILETYNRLKFVQQILGLKEIPDLILYRNTLSFKVKDNKNLTDILFEKDNNDKELQDYLLIQISNTPFLDEYEDNDQLLLSEYTQADRICYGFAIAHQELVNLKEDQKVASFSSDIEWNKFSIFVNYTCVDKCGIYEVKHLGDTKNDADLKQSWLWHDFQEKLLIRDIKSLLDNLEKLPHILLSDQAIQDINSRGEDLVFINKINDFISKINNFCITYWKSDEVNWFLLNKVKSINVRPESDDTLNKYSSERTAKNEHNENEVFSLHLDIRGTSEKIYLKPLYETKKIFIAFITTKHLKTMKY